jgi:hypothetical protein
VIRVGTGWCRGGDVWCRERGIVEPINGGAISAMDGVAVDVDGHLNRAMPELIAHVRDAGRAICACVSSRIHDLDGCLHTDEVERAVINDRDADSRHAIISHSLGQLHRSGFATEHYCGQQTVLNVLNVTVGTKSLLARSHTDDQQRDHAFGSQSWLPSRSSTTSSPSP